VTEELLRELVMPEVLFYGRYRVTCEPARHNQQLVIVTLFYRNPTCGRMWIPTETVTVPPGESLEDYWVRLRERLDNHPEPRAGRLPTMPDICPF